MKGDMTYVECLSIFGENLFDDDWMDFPFDRDFWGTTNIKDEKEC